jgi:glutaredoxin-dependent peroxiredoxin
LDLPKYESLDTQVLGVSVDVLGALQAFAEKLGLTYPLLSDFSRDTVKKYGIMVSDPNSAYYRMAQRSYFVIDKQGIVRYKHIMEDPGHMLDPEEIFNTVKKIATAAQ